MKIEIETFGQFDRSKLQKAVVTLTDTTIQINVKRSSLVCSMRLEDVYTMLRKRTLITVPGVELRRHYFDVRQSMFMIESIKGIKYAYSMSVVAEMVVQRWLKQGV